LLGVAFCALMSLLLLSSKMPMLMFWVETTTTRAAPDGGGKDDVQVSMICGDWTPHGDLNDPDYNATHTEPIVNDLSIPSCGKNSTSVGKPISLDSNRLRCNPNISAGGRAAPILALDLQLSPDFDKPEYSVVMPSYNVRSILELTVPRLCNTTVGLWEVVFVLDGCYDDSLKALRQMLLTAPCSGNENSTLMRARVVVQPTEVFETSSDNIGFLLVNPSHFIIEIQSDMLLEERGWNRDLARPLLEYNDVFSVSGRCGHGQGPSSRASVGRCDKDVGATSEKKKIDTKDAFYITATNNRGPLMFRVDALRKLGYLDEVNFMMGSDDHDLNRRANFYGWYAAYKYVDFYAPLDYSPGRNKTFWINKVPETVQKRKAEYDRFRKEQARKEDCSAGSLPSSMPLRQFSPLTPKKPERRTLHVLDIKNDTHPYFDNGQTTLNLPKLQALPGV